MRSVLIPDDGVAAATPSSHALRAALAIAAPIACRRSSRCTAAGTTVRTGAAASADPSGSVIKGGWHLAGDHGRIDRAQAIRDMATFVEAGITTFDCADIYTGVEEMIGDFRAAHPSLAP